MARNEARNQEWAQLYLEGMSVYQIGAQYGLTGGAVWYVLKKMGVPRRQTIEKIKNEKFKAHHKEWVQLYASGTSSNEIGRQFGVDSLTVLRAIRKVGGINLRTNREAHLKYPCLNAHSFDSIDTEEEAYWLGFLIADGNVFRNMIHVELKESDSAHLIKLATFLGTEAPVHLIPRKKAAKLQVSSPELVAGLNKCGCTPKKSMTIVFPNQIVPDYLMGAFVRGNFDGDGSVFQTRSKRTTGVRVAWSSGSSGFIRSMRKVITDQTGVVSMFYSHYPNRPAILTVERRIDVHRIHKWMYRDATVWLDRKRLRFDELLGVSSTKEGST